VLLLLNDHVLKGAGMVPGWATGKISDIAGMVVAPVLVVALCRARSLPQRVFAFTAVVVPFVLFNVSRTAATLAETITAALGFPWKIWPDPTDLIALPALAIAWLIIASGTRPHPRSAQSTRPRLAYAGAVLAGIACLATSKPVDPKAPLRIMNRSDKPLEICVFHLASPLDCKSLQNGPEAIVTPEMFAPGKCMSTGDYEMRTNWFITEDGEQRSIKPPNGRDTCAAILLKPKGLKDMVVYQRGASNESADSICSGDSPLRIYVDSQGEDIVLNLPSCLEIWHPSWTEP